MREQMISYPNTRAMCSADVDGGATAVMVSGAKLKKFGHQWRRAVKIAASVLTTDPWDPGRQMLPNVNTLTHDAAHPACEDSGGGPEDLDLIELCDCVATAELVHNDNLVLCPDSGAVDFLNSGAPWRDGKTPVIVPGGLESKGHRIAATGIANVHEVCSQFRGRTEDRQIQGTAMGMTHVIA